MQPKKLVNAIAFSAVTLLVIVVAPPVLSAEEHVPFEFEGTLKKIDVHLGNDARSS